MFKAAVVLACLLPLSTAAGAEPSWTGLWDTHWRDGGARMALRQSGTKVEGEYPSYDGRIEGETHGRELKGRWSEGARSGALDFVLAPDGRSFMGRFESGEWWTGGRAATLNDLQAGDQSSPRQSLRTFLTAGNAWRRGDLDQLSLAASVIDFGSDHAGMLTGHKLDAARALFALIDLTTLHLWEIPGADAPGDRIELTLTQAGTGATLPLSVIKTRGAWFIANPAPNVQASARAALLSRDGGRPLAPDAFRERRNPRDTMRSFLEGFSDWNDQGRDQSLGALDLSSFSDAVRDYEGELTAQYLKGILDRVGTILPQELPDDPTLTQPYQVFTHPTGGIVIAPSGSGDKLTWRFTTATVNTARRLYVAVEDMPVLGDRTRQGPSTGYFRLRGWIRRHAPGLLTQIGVLDAWQILAWIGVLCLSFVLAFMTVILVLAAGRRLLRAHRFAVEPDLVWALRLILTFSIYKLLIPGVGLPDLYKSISVGTTGVLLAVALMWGGWRFLDLSGRILADKAETTAATLDNIVVSLAIGALKLGLISAGLLFIAVELSLPYEGMLAGLSIGGLAVAFASKETLSNVFGAGILAIDRPFRRGDWIIAGDVQGKVEKVGIRSTRLRTGDDSLVVVPNGKLSDALVNNFGTRRHHLSRTTLCVAYGATVEQIERFSEELKAIVSRLPGAIPRRTEVMLKALGPDRIELELALYLDGRAGTDEGSTINALMLSILGLADRVGIKLGNQPGLAPEKTSKADTAAAEPA